MAQGVQPWDGGRRGRLPSGRCGKQKPNSCCSCKVLDMSMVTSAYNKWVVVLSHFGLTRLSKGAKKWRTSSSFQSIQRQMVVPKLDQVSSTFLIVMLCLSGDYGVHRIHRRKNPRTLSDSTLTPSPKWVWQVDSWTVYELHFYIDDICCLDYVILLVWGIVCGEVRWDIMILCDIRFEGVSRNRCFIDCFTGAIFAIDWGDFASGFSLLPMVQGTQVATGTIGLPFAQSESLQAWQRLTDGDLATVRISKDILDVLVGCHGVDDRGHMYQMIFLWVLIPVRHISLLAIFYLDIYLYRYWKKYIYVYIYIYMLYIRTAWDTVF